MENKHKFRHHVYYYWLVDIIKSSLIFNLLQNSCLRALEEGEFDDFHAKLRDSKQVLVILTLEC